MATKHLYHHCMDLNAVRYGLLKPHRRHSQAAYFVPAYEWLSRKVGFWPLFLSVGDDKYAHWMTGYHNNWRVHVGSEPDRKVNGKWVYRNIYRRKGEFPNMVMFSFADVDGVFTDYQAWHFALSAYGNFPAMKEELKEWEVRQIFKRSWSKADWLRFARGKGKGDVQLVTPKLDLRTATRVWCRNRDTKKLLETMGFVNVLVKRVMLEG